MLRGTCRWQPTTLRSANRVTMEIPGPSLIAVKKTDHSYWSPATDAWPFHIWDIPASFNLCQIRLPGALWQAAAGATTDYMVDASQWSDSDRPKWKMRNQRSSSYLHSHLCMGPRNMMYVQTHKQLVKSKSFCFIPSWSLLVGENELGV